MFSRFRRAQRASRGSVVHTVVLTLPIMLGFVSMGVDWGEVSVGKIAVRMAVDEAALVAASALSDRPKTEAEISAAYTVAWDRASDYTEQMSINGYDFELESLVFGYYDRTTAKWSATVPTGSSPNAVQAIVSADVDMTFAKLFGVSKVTIRRTSKAGATLVPARAPDLVIVQDVTPSMSSTDIANSKLANQALVECIEEHAHKTTRGGMIKFANIDKQVVPLQSYKDAPKALLNAAKGVSPSSAYSSSGICTSGCTSHASGLYAAVDMLNNATEPPEDIGQAILVITDGAPSTADDGCSATASSAVSATNFQKWLVGSSSARCGLLSAQTTSTGCNNVGGRWFTTAPNCRPSDNGAETSGKPGPGKCTKTAYTNEFSCEGAGGTWTRTTSSTPNPSSLTQWTDQAKAEAIAGKWGPIDVYSVYYSNGATSTYKNNALTFIKNHVVYGAGAEVGPFDAPTGATLVDALEALCEVYVEGTPGLIE